MVRGGADPADPRSKLVLLVDDHEDTRSLLEVIANSGGFKVVSASCGEDAIELLAKKPDLILLDLMMPGCGGLGVLKHLKAVSGPIPPIVVITSYEPRHPSVVEAIMDPNVVQCLAKPVENYVLLEALHRYLKTEPLPESGWPPPGKAPGALPPEFEGNYFFTGFSADAKKRLSASAQRETFPGGMWLFSEGDSSDWVYLVGKGEVELIRNAGGDCTVTLETVQAGGYFGEIGVLENRGRNAGARAKGTVTVVKFPCADVRKILESEPATVTMHLLRGVLTYLRLANDRYMNELIHREKRQTIADMAGGIVHDFKNPLTGINLASKVISTAHPKDEMTLKCCRIIEDQTWRMVGMAQEFLEFAQGRPTLKLEKHLVKDLFERFKTLNNEFLAQAGVRLILEPSTAEIFADSERFLRILQNLVGNAADVLAPKGGEVHLQARRTDGGVEITVKDNGPGIPEAIRDRIFEPFVTHGKERGTGLGMAIVKSLVEAHQGKISFSTETGKGTTFHIRLPAKP